MVLHCNVYAWSDATDPLMRDVISEFIFGGISSHPVDSYTSGHSQAIAPLVFLAVSVIMPVDIPRVLP